MNVIYTVPSHLFKNSAFMKTCKMSSFSFPLGSNPKVSNTCNQKNQQPRVQQKGFDKSKRSINSKVKSCLAFNQISRKNKASFSSGRPIKHINWQFKGPGALLKYPKPNQTSSFYSEKFLIFVYQKITFSHLFTTMGLPLQMQQDKASLQKFVKLPEGLDLDSSVFTFLTDYKNPQKVQFITPFETLVLKNKAMQPDSMEILKVVSDKNSIFGVVNSFKQTMKPNSAADLNKFIVNYYLKMHALHYLRVNKIPLTSQMTSGLKQKIFNHISTFYQENFTKQLRELMNEQIRVNIEIQREVLVKNQLQRKVNSKVKWYKAGAVFVTAVHVGSFTYMIFFVDWLGWDIIQPITYTVGLLYAFLGIRFYRKYHVDRSSQSVKLKISNIFSTANQKIRMQQIQSKIKMLRAEKKTFTQKVLLLKNKLRFQSSLGRCLQKNEEF